MSPLQRTVTGKDRRDLWLSHFISVIFEFQSRAMGDLRPHREFVAKLQLGYHDEQSNSSISDITPKRPPPPPFFFTRFLLLSSVSRYISSFYPQLLTFISYPAKIGIFQSVPLSCERCIFSFSYGRLGGLRLTRTGPQSRSYVSKQQRAAKGAAFILSFHRVSPCVSFWVPGTALGADRPSETSLMRLTCRDW